MVILANFTRSRSGYEDSDPGPGESNQCESGSVTLTTRLLLLFYLLHYKTQLILLELLKPINICGVSYSIALHRYQICRSVYILSVLRIHTLVQFFDDKNKNLKFLSVYVCLSTFMKNVKATEEASNPQKRTFGI